MSKKITLNQNELVLLQYCIDNTEAHQFICHHNFISKDILNKLNMNFEQLKGVFGSLCKKGFFYEGLKDIDGPNSWDSWEWFTDDYELIQDHGMGKLKTAQQVLDYFNQYEGE